MLKKGDIIKILKGRVLHESMGRDAFRELCSNEDNDNYHDYLLAIRWDKYPEDNIYCRIIDIVSDIVIIQTFVTKTVYAIKLPKDNIATEVKCENGNLEIVVSEKYYQTTNMVSSISRDRRCTCVQNIKVGDIVEVRDNGYTYPTYESWVDQYCSSRKYNWKKEYVPNEDSTLYKVIAMHPREFSIDSDGIAHVNSLVACAIEKINTKELIIIGSEGLQKAADSLQKDTTPYLEYEKNYTKCDKHITNFEKVLPALKEGKTISRFTTSWANRYLHFVDSRLCMSHNSKTENYKLDYGELNANDWYVLD